MGSGVVGWHVLVSVSECYRLTVVSWCFKEFNN